MANPTPIIFTLTDAGLNAALDAQNNGLTLKLSKVAVGTGKYNSSAAQNRTALATQWGEFALAGAGIEPNSKTLRFSAIIKSSVQKDVFEIGLLSDNGVLFAVASTTTAPLFAVSENVDYIGAFGLTITGVPINNVQVVVDTNAALAIALMQQHLAQPNPHPQYTQNSAFNAHVAQNQSEHEQFGYDIADLNDDLNAVAESAQNQINAEGVTRQIAINLLNSKIDGLTTASSQFSINGYTNLPTGLVMQWGTVDFDGNPPESSNTVQFPIAFPNACLNVQATRKIVTANSREGDGGILFESATPTTATFSLQKFSDTSDEKLRGYTWFAIGY